MLNNKPSIEDTVLFFSFPALSYDYPVQSSLECIKTCCEDIIDTTVNKTICSGETYILPDGYVVKDSGTYYSSYKTTKGCDSIASYHFNVIKNPGLLKLTGSLCFEGVDSIVISATGGFDKYNWSNNVSDDSLSIITRPGIYWVEVSNGCGSKRDSIEIFEKCDFPVYIPNAFTPNGDGLNDVFRIPPQNQNKLIKLSIYNRWGKKVFETTEEGSGWDGKVNNVPQPNGVYLYLVIMKELSGKPIKLKGEVTLIR